jgi:protein arginine N-methyltransferase 7
MKQYLQNKKYYAALAEAIKMKRELGEPVNVLDIGTGTGLLSMMAAKLGADTVTACEVILFCNHVILTVK